MDFSFPAPQENGWHYWGKIVLAFVGSIIIYIGLYSYPAGKVTFHKCPPLLLKEGLGVVDDSFPFSVVARFIERF
jgi:hypothetical protein